MNQLRINLLLTLIIFNVSLFAQEQLTQTVRGRIIDNDSKIPVIGATAVIQGSNPILGASADIDGYFTIKNVPIGRVNIAISALGYEKQLLPNIIVESGKEAFVNVKLTETFETLATVTVTAKGNERKDEVINKMASVSAKTVTTEETGRYAGSLNDPARMVSAFAGVMGDGAGNNDIVVRGNSPRGILWRLEGMEIPNPNHFSNEGSSSGPVNALNANMLSNCDFFSGAFAPEYGNALSGVFDTRFRTGNNEKHEQTFSLGVLGTDITLEGPFSKDYNGSYLFNYRYSTLELLDKAGIVDFGGIPKYQDASMKINLPTKKHGYFSLVGLWGNSSIFQDETVEDTEEIFQKNDVNAGLAFVGLKHNYIMNDNVYIQSYASYSGSNSGIKSLSIDDETNSFYTSLNSKFTNSTYRLSTLFNAKINNRNTVKTGVIYSLMDYNMDVDRNDIKHTQLSYVFNDEGNTSMIQAYATWKYRILKDLTMVSGVHYTQLMLNNNFSVDPRIGLKWQMNPKQYISLGAGLHSKVEPISVYMANGRNSGVQNTNKNLELSKAAHAVVGFGHQFTENLFFKTELYYQHLYDVPVENLPGSSYSILNESAGFINKPLTNGGKGRNYGIELTLERFFNNNFYYLMTGSLFDSKYTAKDGIERDTRFNAQYAGNLVLGKEFQLPTRKKNKTLAINLKASLLGGNMSSVIDLEGSKAAGETVYFDDKIFSEKADDFFYLNLGITYRSNRKRTTHEIKLDIQNVTNNAVSVGQYYSEGQERIIDMKQLALTPNIIYTIKF